MHLEAISHFFSYPRILGHELSGQIVEIDNINNKGLRIGDKVIIMPYISCLICKACKNGKTNCCTNIKVLGVHIDGGMQEYISIPLELLMPANNLTDSEITIVEPLAIGAHAIRRSEIKKDALVLVVGCGPIGIGIMKLAQINGAKVIAMDVNNDRLVYVKEKIGIEHTVLADLNSFEKILELTNGELVDTVFDATGNQMALEKGINYMSHGGKYVLVGLSKGNISFHHPSIHAKEASIICSRNATFKDFIDVKTIIEQKIFPIDSYITHSIRFENMISEFNTLLLPESKVIKAIVNL